MSTLSPEKWIEVSPLLDEALSLGNQERAAWIGSLEKDKPELASLLKSLLEEHSAAASEHFLENAVVSREASLQGRQIGPYTLVSPIGEGGMGSVWLAERSDGRFERRVAIKFLHFSVAAHGGIERFKREGKILGQLSHPHIAELIDAGVTPTGEPYLVLEYVDGAPIPEYCDSRKLSVEGRIKLFLDVLSAVAQAHANLIVHRDLKPSNVLVRNDGEVKLLDFGIAKLLADEMTPAAATQLTLEGGSALTPMYAAPEQVTGGAVTTATDVYALGVLLYLLLTGKHPAGSETSAAGLVKAIVDTEPSRASDAAASSGAADVARNRSVTTEKLRRQLRGDLDTVVRKALKKNPAERYSTVTAFADDLRRYLNQEPISARPDTLSYRVTKFVRRNRVAVALSSAALIAIIAGAIGVLIQSRAARRERDAAVRQLARAERLNNFNNFLLTDARAANVPLSVNELLDRAREIVERENYSADPANHVQLLISIAEQYESRGNTSEQIRLLQKAYEISRNIQDHSARARASCTLADAIIDETGNQSAKSESLIQEGLRELDVSPQFAVDRAYCLWKGGDIAAQNGKAREAIARDQAAADIVNSSGIETSYLKLQVQLELARAYADVQLDKAITAQEKALEMERELGYDRTRTASNTLGTYAWMLMRAGRPRDAQQAYRQGMDIFGDDSLGGWALQAYAECLRQLGRLDEAAHYAELGYQRSLQQKNQPSMLMSMTALLRVYRDQRDFSRAENELRQLQPLMQKILTPTHYWYARVASEQSLLAAAEGRLPEALGFADDAVSRGEAALKSSGEGAVFLPISLQQRADVEIQLKQYDKAKADAEHALSLLEQSLGKNTFSADIGRCYLALGRALQAKGDMQAARADFRFAADNFEHALGPDHAETRAARQLAGLELKN